MGFCEAYGKGSGRVVLVSVAGRQEGGVGGLQDTVRLGALPAKITPVSEFSMGEVIQITTCCTSAVQHCVDVGANRTSVVYGKLEGHVSGRKVSIDLFAG